MSGDEGNFPGMFRLLTEIGIIAQLSGSAFEKVMPARMTLPQFHVLNHLTRLGNNPTPLDLSRAMQVSKGAMTNTLGHLARAGWIAIDPDKKDGRSKRIILTGAGRHAHGDAIAAVAPELAWLCTIIPPDTVGDLTPALERLRQALDRRRD